jgi:hypothetical protein
VTFGAAAGLKERELLPSMPGRCCHSPAEGIKTRPRRDPGVMRLLARSFTLTGLGSVTPVVMTTDRAVSVPPLESLSR